MYWWPKYKKIKLRKKEELRAEALNTGGAKLSEVRWPKAMCAVCRSRNTNSLNNLLYKANIVASILVLIAFVILYYYLHIEIGNNYLFNLY